MSKLAVKRIGIFPFVILFAVFCSSWDSSQAQIAITMDEIPAAPGVSKEYSVETGDSIPVDLGLTGGPHTWDFSQPATPDTADTTVERIVAPEDTPFGESFPEANLAIETEAVDIVGIDTASGYQFLKLDEESLGFLGLGFQDSEGNPYVIDLDSPLTTIPLPLEYGTTWSDVSEFSGTFQIPNPEGSPLPGEYLDVKIDLEYGRDGTVDGWGNVTTTLGEYEALRVRRYETTYVNLSVFILIGYVSIFDTTISIYVYDWYTEDLGQLVTVTSRGNEEDSLFSVATSVRKLVWTNILEARPGDINGDGVVDVQDVVMSVNHILEIEFLEGDALERADCNDDGRIDLLDVFGVVSVILGVGQCEPTAGRPGLTQEILAFFERLRPHFSTVDFARFMALVKGEMGSPEGYYLAQNYPNPFNATTEIRFRIPEANSPVHTTLKVYNMLGQEVATLVNDMREPGQYRVTWDGRDVHGSDVSSGVYFLRFTTEEFTATKRLLLMK